MAERVLKEKQVLERCATSHASMWRGVAAGTFPAPRKLGARAVGWLESDINDHLRNLPTTKDLEKTG